MDAQGNHTIVVARGTGVPPATWLDFDRLCLCVKVNAQFTRLNLQLYLRMVTDIGNVKHERLEQQNIKLIWLNRKACECFLPRGYAVGQLVNSVGLLSVQG